MGESPCGGCRREITPAVIFTETRYRDFGKHSVNAVVVQSAQKETYKGVYVKATDYPNDYIQTITGGTVSDGTSKTTEWSLASYLARVLCRFRC